MSYKINILYVFVTTCFLVCVLFWGKGLGVAYAAHASDPAIYELQRFQTAAVHDEKGQILVLWITPKAPYSIYAHDSGGGLPLTLTVMPDAGVGAQVWHMPGTLKPDPLEPSLSLAMHSERTPVFVLLESANSGATLQLSMLLCSSERCQPVRRKWTIDRMDQKEYAALPRAEEQPWWPALQDLRSAEEAGRGEPGFMPETQASGTALTETAQGGASADDSADEAVTLVESWELVPRYLRPGLEVRGLAMAMLLGLCAGAILNIMPCVLPVITLKLSAFAAAAGTADAAERVRRFRRHNIFFSIGILAWFALLSLILGGGNSMWGQAFQQPWLVAAMLALVFILSLSLFGLYSLPLLQFGQSGAERKEGAHAAFAAGFLATILATPCSGPLLGGVLGYAFRQPPLLSGIVFMSVGVGMALPYLLLALWPGLAARFPKPGPWLRIVGKIVAFFLLATCGYLFLLLPGAWRIPAAAVMLGCVPLLGLWGRFRLGAAFFEQPNLSFRKKAWAALAKGKALQSADSSLAPRWKELWGAIAALGILLFLASGLESPSRTVRWETFQAAEFGASLGKAPFLVDFTADWCPNCKLLERGVLTEANLAAWQKRYGLRLVRVDLSQDNPAGQALLAHLGSSSIPVVALFPLGAEKNRPLVLRDMFGKSALEEALATILH